MSVQKFKISKSGGFTVVPNKVAQSLNSNLAALGLYTYLSSLSEGWEFHKSHLQKVCSIGINKLNTLLKVLENCALIKVAQKRGPHGYFAHFDLEVFDGTSFDINGLGGGCAPLIENGDTVNRATVNSTYKRNIEKRNIEKENINNSYASDDAQKSFEKFWIEYPRKKDKLRTHKIWVKQKLYEISDTIISDLVKRKSTEWHEKDMQYIPHPSTYLNGQRWNDEITPTNKSGEKNNANIKQSHTTAIWNATKKLHIEAVRENGNRTRKDEYQKSNAIDTRKLDYNPFSTV